MYNPPLKIKITKMTKKEWYSLQIGTRVFTESNKLERVDGKVISTKVILTGTIERINSNRSQVVVNWGDCTNWYGRLGIELVK